MGRSSRTTKVPYLPPYLRKKKKVIGNEHVRIKDLHSQIEEFHLRAAPADLFELQRPLPSVFVRGGIHLIILEVLLREQASA